MQKDDVCLKIGDVVQVVNDVNERKEVFVYVEKNVSSGCYILRPLRLTVLSEKVLYCCVPFSFKPKMVNDIITFEQCKTQIYGEKKIIETWYENTSGDIPNWFQGDYPGGPYKSWFGGFNSSWMPGSRSTISQPNYNSVMGTSSLYNGPPIPPIQTQPQFQVLSTSSLSPVYNIF